MKKRIVFYLTISFVVFFVSKSFADPIINSDGGSFNHRGTITISGSSFGTKSPAAPIIWDATDNFSASNLDTHWPGTTPSRGRYPTCAAGSQGDNDVTSIQMAYRASYPDDGGTPMTYPHSRVTKYICGGISNCNGAWGTSTVTGANTITTDTWEADKVFAMYYYRVSPTYSQESSAYSDNFKEISANGGTGEYLDGNDTYTGYCGAHVPPAVYPNDVSWYGRWDYGGGYQSSCQPLARTYLPNPMTKWIHVELFWDTDIEVAFTDNISFIDSGSGEPKNINEADGTDPTTITIGGFIRWPRASVSGNYRYWAALYLDDTYSRVMLGNNSNWDNCDIREPQIPSAWSNSSITFTVNLGAFPGNGTAYLFVFDTDDNHNPTGYPVTLGGGGGGDTTPPDIPTGLTIATTTIP